jgi:hypothetical protein
MRLLSSPCSGIVIKFLSVPILSPGYCLLVTSISSYILPAASYNSAMSLFLTESSSFLNLPSTIRLNSDLMWPPSVRMAAHSPALVNLT